ncbi:MAG TPA: MFS transporter, partial [Jiangellales bacterium]|nr:MFS transporter [Jiangellales bacterium]
MLTAREARTRYLIVEALRWYPTGLLLPVLALLPLERGLTVAQLGLAAAVQGAVVLALELPTGGLSDSLGRRPVLVASVALSLASLALLFAADSVALFAAAFAVQGGYRALDSGPLQAWYVDASLATDPGRDVTGGLSAGAAVTGIAIAGGALSGAGLVAVRPFHQVEALATPILAAGLVQIVALVAVGVLITEPRRPRGWRAVMRSVASVPRVIGGGLRLLRGSRILAALVGVELFWGFGMVAFEVLMPIRLAEVTDSSSAAAAMMGPAGAGAWAAAAAGAAIAGLAARWFSPASTAATLRVIQGVTVAAMAVFAGPVGIVAAYLATYAVHGGSNPLHHSLLHQQVTSEHRTTVLSLNSMVAQPAGAAGLVVLTALADGTSVRLAIV